MKKHLTLFIAALFFAFATSGYSQSRTFTGKPMYQILTKRGGVTLGTTVVELFPNIAPMHVSNFDSLVSYQFFDSTAFHRVIPGFMIQGGDPNSRSGPRSTWGYGDPSQPTVNAEFTAAKHLRGTLSAARDASINSANSQFFICVAPAAWLNGAYSVYGHVTSGMNIVDTIVSAPRDSVDNPLLKIEMFITYIGSNDTVPNAPLLNLPISGSANASTARALKWFAVSDAIIYHVEVSTDSLFSTFYKSVDVGTNTYTVTGLSGGTKYYWRVKTNNGGQWSTYSSVWNFYVYGVGIQEFAGNAGNILVSPNPGNGRFVFSNLEKENSIEIYDITGKLISKKIAESGSCTIDLTEKEKGVYFYIVRNQNTEIQQGKIILQ
ncbi:MAG TPA: peptidylprolyl isomerase [Bacteroidia bacterium]|jgi:cyclophilin family peptidyl-prolyl cis-trans isomerase